MSGLPCPHCGGELAFLAQYQRHYCYACGRYAPEGFGDRGAKRCPTCTGILSYVTQYDRFYCYRCGAYPPEGTFMDPRASASRGTVDAPAATGSTATVLYEPSPSQGGATSPSAGASSGSEPTAGEEVQPEEIESQKPRRPLDREEITTAKKPLLAQLCNDYDLDTTGSREELRQRLLSYLDQLESTSSSEAPAEATQDAAEEQGEDSASEASSAESMETEEQAAPEMTSEAEPEVIETQPGPQPSNAATERIVETLQTPAREAVEPIIVATPSQEPARSEGPSHPAAKVEHPCPTCGRALTFIPQYDRWYCYSCRTYAPRAKAKFACPNCGASLRWITQYSRWWCDACRRYAPADLPKPNGAATRAASVAEAVATRPAVATIVAHRHQSPGSGIGLVTFGLLLFVIYEVLVDLPVVLAVDTGFIIGPDVAFGLRFFGILFVAVGTILGLSAIRDRR